MAPRHGILAGLPATPPDGLERWFAAAGPPPSCDLARSGALPLSIAELLEAAGGRAQAELLGVSLDYGDPRGTARLRQAVAASGAARSADEVVITAGAAEALLLAAAALLEPQDAVRLAVPDYEGLARSMAAVGATVERIAVWEPPATRLDASGLVVGGDHRLVVLNSPHNPTGLVWPGSVVEALARRLHRRGGRLVVDEVARGTLDPRARSVTALPAYSDGAIVSVADVSKSFGLGGLRIGWLACADPVVRERAAALKDVTSLGPPAPSQLLAAMALERRDRLAPRIRQVATANRAHLADWVRRTPGAWWVPPRDGLVAFPRLPCAVGDQSLAAVLRAEHGVALVPGSLFDRPGHIRIGLGLPAELFTAGLEAITTVMRLPAGGSADLAA
jgi:aspartate/methionine/tyrosine aminotransferase